MKNQEYIAPITTDINGVMAMTGLSKNKAMQLGNDAGAVVKLGIRRTLYNVAKIQAYIDSKTAASDSDMKEG